MDWQSWTRCAYDIKSTLLFFLSALMNVKRQLVSGDYVKALAVLKAAVVTWPDYEMFKTGAQADGEKSTHESEENRYLTFRMRLHLADFNNFIQQT